MDDAYEIRKLTLPRDRAMLGALHELYDRTYGFHRRPGEIEALLDRIERRGDLYTCLALLCRGEPVGYARFYERLSTSSCDLVGMLDIVEVRSDHRGRGQGRRLVEEVLRRAEAAGLARIDLLADVDNEPAQRLYRSLGFEGRKRLQMHRFLKASPELEAYFEEKKAREERRR